MEKLKIGVIGAGTVSEFHLNAYEANPAVEICALSDINAELLEKRALRYGVKRTFASYSDLLRCEEVDAVSVCTHNALHAECSIAALNAGKHVLCEKPMALDLKQALEMRDAAKRSGKLLMVGLARRFGEDARAFSELSKDGLFGDVYYVKASYLRRCGSPGGWFGSKAAAGGGAMTDLGIHMIDLARFLTDSPKPISVYAATFQKLGERGNIKRGADYRSLSAGSADAPDVEDLATAMIRFDNGMVMSLDSSFSLHTGCDRNEFELFGTKGGAKFGKELEIYTEKRGYLANVRLDADMSLSMETMFKNEIAHFVSCVTDGVPCIASAEEGVVLAAVIDAIYRSSDCGHEADVV
jgi:predicted dehydrogenase